MLMSVRYCDVEDDELAVAPEVRAYYLLELKARGMYV